MDHDRHTNGTYFDDLTSHVLASIMQRCIIDAIDHLPHVNSISNSLSNSGDVSSRTRIEQLLCRRRHINSVWGRRSSQGLPRHFRVLIWRTGTVLPPCHTHHDCACVLKSLGFLCPHLNSSALPSMYGVGYGFDRSSSHSRFFFPAFGTRQMLSTAHLIDPMRCTLNRLVWLHVLNWFEKASLTLGACARGLQYSLCVCVCSKFPAFKWSIYNKVDLPACLSPVFLDLQLTDLCKMPSF